MRRIFNFQFSKIVRWQAPLIYKALLIFIFTFYILHSTFLTPVLGVDSTSSAKAASPSSSLVEKIDIIKKQIASKAASLKPEVNKKLENKAFYGVIVEKDGSKITVGSKDKQKQILVNEYTTYQNTSKKLPKPKTLASLDDLKKDDFIVALGDVDDKNVLVAKKVVKADEVKFEDKKYIWGQIEAVNNPQITIKGKDALKQVLITSFNTSFYLGAEESSILDAKVGQFLVGRGILKDEKLNLDYVYFIPTAGFIKPAPKSASPSAKTLTPSASTKSP